MQGSGQSVAFDYQSPAAPLLAPWHEHHIRRSDLHRNVSVSIVVSKFTIYRHSRRSPVSETLLCWSSRLSAFIFWVSFFLHILLVVAVGLLFCLFSSAYLQSCRRREVKLYMGTWFGDAALLRCWARWWGLFNNIDVKIQRFSFFPSRLLYGEDRSLTEPKEEKRKEFISAALWIACLSSKRFFFYPILRPCESLCFVAILYFATPGLWFSSNEIRDSWMADCNLPWNWPPDTCISWSGAYSIAFLYFECIDRVATIWDCVLWFDFALPCRLRAPFFPHLRFINTGDHFAL